jgi:hypothetical protein
MTPATMMRRTGEESEAADVQGVSDKAVTPTASRRSVYATAIHEGR